MAVPWGHIRLTCDDPSADLLLLLGPEAPRITGGLGGWEITGRPQQISMTTWQGSEPFQVQLSVMLDGYAADAPVGRTLRRLVAVARGDDESPPGVLAIQGIPLPAKRWVLEGMEFGDPINTTRGRPLRQPLSLTLREYVPPTFLQIRRRALQGSKRKTRVVTTKKADTPAKLARRLHCRWTEIRELNPGLVRKANQKLKVGTKLRCPVAVRRDRKPKGRHGSSKGRKD